jgi:hypothetical protein
MAALALPCHELHTSCIDLGSAYRPFRPEPVVFCCAFGLKLPPNRHTAVGALSKAVSILSATLSLTTFAHSQAERYDALANSAMFENRPAFGGRAVVQRTSLQDRV